MEFKDLDVAVQQQIADLLQTRLTTLETNVKKYKSIVPVLMVDGEDEESNILATFQSGDGGDVDKALAKAVEELTKLNFIAATFSYSTQIGVDGGSLRDAVKNYIILKNGLTVVFFTPYRVSGLFKKQVAYEKSMIGEIIPDIFNA